MAKTSSDLTKDLRASELWLLEKCSAAGALPRVQEDAPEMARGTFIHEYLEAGITGASEEKLEELRKRYPNEVAKTCVAIDLAKARSLVSPGGGKLLVEQDMRISLGPRLPGLRGRADAMSFLPSDDMLIVSDFKSGDGWKEPPEDSIQVSAYAVLALETSSEMIRKWSVVAQIIAVRSDGSLYPLTGLFSPEDVAASKARIVGIASDVLQARKAVAAGEDPRFTVGAHCGWCRSLPYCRAQRGTALALIEDEATITASKGNGLDLPIPAPVLAAAYHRAQALEKVVEKVKAAIREQVKMAGSVPTREGWELRMLQRKEEVLHPGIAMNVLLEHVEPEAAVRAFVVTKAGISRAIGSPEITDAALDEIRARGGAEERVSEFVKEVKVRR